MLMNTLFLILMAAVAGILAASLIWVLAQWRREHARAEALAVANGRLEERLRQNEEQREVTGALVRAQAAESAQAVADMLVQRATETLQAHDRVATAHLEAQLKPLAETLTKFETQVAGMDRIRAAEAGGLKEQISALLTASQRTQEEARKLSAALRRGAGVQGRWGEETLRNVLEAAGLQSRFDYEVQVTVQTDDGRLRPDVVVKLAGGGAFVVDAKVSLTAYLESQEAGDEQARRAALQRHAQALKSHVNGLAAKAYWEQFDNSPEFVAMFVAGDGILATALECMPDLVAYAMARRVLIVSPTGLFGLCSAVAHGWRAAEQAENAREVAALGQELYRRLAVMGGHAAGVGKALDAAVGKYNAFVTSLESQVLTQARRFEALKVEHGGRPVEEVLQVDSECRSLVKLSVAPEPTPDGRVS
jgi:DNA recombination protein RmuC